MNTTFDKFEIGKIPLVKMVRKGSGCNLREAKEAVELFIPIGCCDVSLNVETLVTMMKIARLLQSDANYAVVGDALLRRMDIVVPPSHAAYGSVAYEVVNLNNF